MFNVLETPFSELVVVAYYPGTDALPVHETQREDYVFGDSFFLLHQDLALLAGYSAGDSGGVTVQHAITGETCFLFFSNWRVVVAERMSFGCK